VAEACPVGAEEAVGDGEKTEPEADAAVEGAPEADAEPVAVLAGEAADAESTDRVCAWTCGPHAARAAPESVTMRAAVVLFALANATAVPPTASLDGMPELHLQ
jgi:hypothetical protein